MEKRYSESFRIPSYELDESRQLKLSSILKLMQEIAGRHLEEDGLSYEVMRNTGVVFLLTNVAVKINRLPVYAEVLRGETWFCETRHAQFVRCMRFSANGETLLEAQTLWVTVDPVKHRILRPNEFHFGMPENDRETVSVTAGRISCPDQMEPLEDRKLRRTDIDCNGHMGNFVYADIVCDNLPDSVAIGDVSELHIAYQREALPGQTLQLFRAAADGGLYFKAVIGNSRCFETFVKLRNQ